MRIFLTFIAILLVSCFLQWAKGSKLGDTVIPSPIKQCISGIGGVSETWFHLLASIRFVFMRDLRTLLIFAISSLD